VDSESITEAQFEERVIHSPIPVILDYGAEWCHPCKQLDPVLEEIAQEWKGKIKVYKVDGDQEVNLVTRFGVMGLPTLILFVDGEPKERMTGFKPKKKIISQFGKYID